MDPSPFSCCRCGRGRCWSQRSTHCVTFNSLIFVLVRRRRTTNCADKDCSMHAHDGRALCSRDQALRDVWHLANITPADAAGGEAPMRMCTPLAGWIGKTVRSGWPWKRERERQIPETHNVILVYAASFQVAALIERSDRLRPSRLQATTHLIPAHATTRVQHRTTPRAQNTKIFASFQRCQGPVAHCVQLRDLLAGPGRVIQNCKTVAGG